MEKNNNYRHFISNFYLNLQELLLYLLFLGILSITPLHQNNNNKKEHVVVISPNTVICHNSLPQSMGQQIKSLHLSIIHEMNQLFINAIRLFSRGTTLTTHYVGLGGQLPYGTAAGSILALPDGSTFLLFFFSSVVWWKKNNSEWSRSDVIGAAPVELGARKKSNLDNDTTIIIIVGYHLHIIIK